MALGIWIALGILAALIAIVLLFIVGIYNKLVVLKNRFLNAFAQIEVQLKRRHDLIPSLVETVKGYMAHEKETLEAVINARNAAANALKSALQDTSNPETMQSLASAEGALGGAMGGLFAVMEAYPDLKADKTMSALQEELTSTENKIAFSRQAYNDSIAKYNSHRQSFPQVIIAPLVGHGKDAAFLEFEDSAQIQAAPKIDITGNE
ncbi:MAG: LemA family protein [Phycisphaerales bacterium]|nr:LemA family protein [Phycisphaerales bacterium]